MKRIFAAILGHRFLESLGIIALCSAVVLAATRLDLPFGPWHRLLHQPVLAPRRNGFESAGVFNPAVLRNGSHIVMLYRAQDDNEVSRLGYATSSDGLHFERRHEPVLVPEVDYEQGGGVEDPRLVEIDDSYYLTYTAYNKKDAQLCLAVSRDLVHWVRRGVIMPAYRGRWNVGWTKAGAILDQKVGGQYWMYFQGELPGRPSQMGVASSEDLAHWTEPLDHPVLETRAGHFDSKVVEPGPPPLMTSQGILLIYNGANQANVFATGWVLFDKSEPSRVIARCERPVFTVEESWERSGQVPNVVFVEGMIQDRKRWLFYYGAADKYIGVAAAPSRITAAAD